MMEREDEEKRTVEADVKEAKAHPGLWRQVKKKKTTFFLERGYSVSVSAYL
jgi:hypothetical protein